jgi:flagellar basal body-associated protein FliL
LASLAILSLTPASFAADRSAVPEMIEGAPTYVRFRPIFIPIIEKDRVTRQIGITLMLQLNKGQEKDEIEEKRPLLNDAFMSDLYVFFQQRATVRRSIDQVYLKDRLLKVASNIVGPEAVQEVLIQQLFEDRK